MNGALKIASYQLKGVLLDFDGTLTRAGAIDFPMIKRRLGCPLDTPVLEFIQEMSSAADQAAAHALLEAFEMEAAAASTPNAGAEDLVQWIKAKRLRVGILTRNKRASVLRSLENFHRIREADFDLIITRDDPVLPKPSGDGIAWAARHWGITPDQILLVGDFILDAQAGCDAGALTALLDPEDDPRMTDTPCDFRIRHLSEVKPVVRQGLPLATGKLPNALLQSFLQEFGSPDPSVLVGAGVGEDIAAVDVADCEVLILKSDPITFATDAMGRYAVLVNANDIATAGADPRWFLTTLLLPRGITPSQVRGIMGELSGVCQREGIALCGGHTEITDAVARPVVIGMMIGTVARGRLIEKTGMRTGDRVLMTKAAAVEATAILAREFEERLLQKGISARQIEVGKGFLDRISIVPEARLAAMDGMASALHDVTEGGVATALEELSIAGGHRIAVDPDRIPVLAPTRQFCAALDLDPLGLIGSGSLLICCRPEHQQVLEKRLRDSEIEVSAIGRVLEAGTGIDAASHGRPATWPRFRTDEITRLFQKSSDDSNP